MRRSGRYYRKNESEVMKSLGLTPTRNSGSGWIEKEDGQSEYIICQLKSTDARSINIRQQDMCRLEYNAVVSHKVPVFAIQFLNNNDLWLMVKPSDIGILADYMCCGRKNDIVVTDDLAGAEEEEVQKNIRKVSSSPDARRRYQKQRENQYRREKSAK